MREPPVKTENESANKDGSWLTTEKTRRLYKLTQSVAKMRSCWYGYVNGDTARPLHMSSVGIVEPAGHTKPLAHGRHVDALPAPTIFENVPAGHCWHVDTIGAPVATLYVPAMQLVQFARLVAPARIPYVPVGQAVHAEEAAAPTVELNVPGTQAEQEEGGSAYVPAGQLVDDREQAEAPDTL